MVTAKIIISPIQKDSFLKHCNSLGIKYVLIETFYNKKQELEFLFEVACVVNSQLFFLGVAVGMDHIIT